MNINQIVIKLITKIEQRFSHKFNERDDVQKLLEKLLKEEKVSFKSNHHLRNPILEIHPDIIILNKKGNFLHPIELKVRGPGESNSNPVDFLSESGPNGYCGGRNNILTCKKFGMNQGSVIYIYRRDVSQKSKIVDIKNSKFEVCYPKKYFFIKQYYVELIKKNGHYKFFNGLIIHNGRIKKMSIKQRN
jgi:hypothetical protein